MWFKVFVLLRIPISVLCLVGYATTLQLQRILAVTLGVYFIAVAISTALFGFLAVVSIKLVRRRPCALRLAGMLLVVEVVGALMLLVGTDYARFGRVEPVKAAGVLLGALVLWALPNALLFYKARKLF
jgi:hypothetical protein